MKEKEEIIAIMQSPTGTTSYHRFSGAPDYPVITDGVKAVAEAAECFWLLDLIVGHQQNKKLKKDFQVWVLEADKKSRCTVLFGYDDMTPVIREEISFTDFPLDKIKLYLINGVILLPSEY